MGIFADLRWEAIEGFRGDDIWVHLKEMSLVVGGLREGLITFLLYYMNIASTFHKFLMCSIFQDT